MGPEREYAVAVFVSVIAVLVIVGGYASFSGLAVETEPLSIEMIKGTFQKSDVFDANVVVNPVTFFSDESLVIYVDDRAVGAVALRKYLDDTGLSYGVEVKNLGNNNVEILTLRDPLRVSLSDYISLEYTQPGSTHRVRVEFSRGDALAEVVFGVE